MTDTINTQVGDKEFTVRLQSPSAKRAFEQLYDGNNAATARDALTTVSDIDDADVALMYLMDKWGTNQSQTVREALRRAASEGGT